MNDWGRHSRRNGNRIGRRITGLLLGTVLAAGAVLGGIGGALAAGAQEVYAKTIGYKNEQACDHCKAVRDGDAPTGKDYSSYVADPSTLDDRKADINYGDDGYATAEETYEKLLDGAVYRGGNSGSGLQDPKTAFDADPDDFAKVLPYGDTYIDTSKITFGKGIVEMNHDNFMLISSSEFTDSKGNPATTDPFGDGRGLASRSPIIAYVGPIKGYLGDSDEEYRGQSQAAPKAGNENIFENSGDYLYRITYPGAATLKDGTKGNLVFTVTRVEIETTATDEQAIITLQTANNFDVSGNTKDASGEFYNTQKYIAKTKAETEEWLDGTELRNSNGWPTDKSTGTATGAIIDFEINVTDAEGNSVDGSISYAARDMDLDNYQDLWGRKMTEEDRHKFNEALTIKEGALSYAVTPYYDHANATTRATGWIPVIPGVESDLDSPLYIEKTGTGDKANGVRFSGRGAVVMRDKNGTFENALVAWGEDTGTDIRSSSYGHQRSSDLEYKDPADYSIHENIKKQLVGKIKNGSDNVAWNQMTNQQIFEYLGKGSYGTRRGDDATFDTGFAVLLDASGTKMQWSGSMQNNGSVVTTIFDTSVYTYVEQSHGVGGGTYLETYDIANDCKVDRDEGTVTTAKDTDVTVTVVPEDGHRVKTILVGGKGLSEPKEYKVAELTFTEGKYVDSGNGVTIEQNADGTYDVTLAGVQDPRHVHADFTADYYFYKVWKDAAENGVPTTDLTLKATLVNASGESQYTTKIFVVTKDDADNKEETNVTVLKEGNDIVWKIKYPAEGYTTKGGTVWPALGIEPEAVEDGANHDQVRYYWFVTETVNGWKLAEYSNAAAEAPGVVDAAAERGETVEVAGGDELNWAKTAKKDNATATSTITAKTDAAFLSVFTDGGKIENQITPPVGTPKETWGAKNTPQTADGKSMFRETTEKTTTGANNTIVNVELLDAEGNPATSVTVPEGTYTIDDAGKITFTPNTDFVGNPTPVRVRGTDGNGLTADTTYTPHVVDTEETVTRTITYEYSDGTPVKDAEGKPLTVVQTVTFTGTVNPDTGKITWSDDQELAKVDSDPIEGYTVDKESVPAVTVKATDDDLTEKVIYSPKGVKAAPDETWGLPGEEQTGTPTFEMETPTMPDGSDNKLTIKLIDPETGEPADTVTIPGQGTYVLNENGTITFTPEEGYVGNPDPVTVEGTDLNGKTARTTYTPHIVDPTSQDTATRTVHFTYLTEDGEEVTEDVTQELTLTRHASKVDPATGEVLEWGPWEKKSFPAVTNPDDKVDGRIWTTDDAAGEIEVTEPGDKGIEYIVYEKVPYTVVYHDGEHGTSDGKGDQPSEDYDSDVTGGNTVTPDKGWKFTGKYTYIITDRDGNVIGSGETDDPTSLKVIGNIEFTPVYEKLPHATYVDPATDRTIQEETDFPEEGVEPDSPADPERPGYTFDGWDREVDEEGNVLYKARWVPWKYTIKYDANGGTGTMDDQNFTSEDETAKSKTNEFVRPGYKFTGFKAKDADGNYLKDADGNDLFFSDPKDFMDYLASQGPDSEVTLEAQWAKLPHATYIDPATGRVIQVTMDFLDENTEPPAPADPTREGYVFVGWDREVDDEGNVVYKAKWEPVSEKKTTPAKPNKEIKASVRTGDENKPYIWIAILGAAAAALLVVLIALKKRGGGSGDGPEGGAAEAAPESPEEGVSTEETEE